MTIFVLFYKVTGEIITYQDGISLRYTAPGRMHFLGKFSRHDRAVDYHMSGLVF